jgi:hypothetical protein
MISSLTLLSKPLHMNLIDEIKERLAKYPSARYFSSVNSITVLPLSDQGFTVELTANGGDAYTVFFNGWHEDFDNSEEALNVFALGLSTDCRLREYQRGQFAYKWTLEWKDEGHWIEQSTTGLLLFPFWRKANVRVLQNNLIVARSPANTSAADE